MRVTEHEVLENKGEVDFNYFTRVRFHLCGAFRRQFSVNVVLEVYFCIQIFCFSYITIFLHSDFPHLVLVTKIELHIWLWYLAQFVRKPCYSFWQHTCEPYTAKCFTLESNVCAPLDGFNQGCTLAALSPIRMHESRFCLEDSEVGCTILEVILNFNDFEIEKQSHGHDSRFLSEDFEVDAWFSKLLEDLNSNSFETDKQSRGGSRF